MWLCADEQPTWNLWLYVISGELQYPDCAPGERRSSAGSTEYLLISFFNTQVWQKFGSQLLCVEQLRNASRCGILLSLCQFDLFRSPKPTGKAFTHGLYGFTSPNTGVSMGFL
jgi:hypothetical protein